MKHWTDEQAWRRRRQASEESEDMAISPSSRGTSAETGKTGTWKLVAEETGDWTVGEHTGEIKTDSTEVDGIVTGVYGTGVDTEVETTGVDIVETGADVDGCDGSGVDTEVETGVDIVETGADVDGCDGSGVDVLEGQFRATCPGCRHFRHRPEYRQSRGR